MILSLISLAVVGGIAYFWLTKGFLNGLVHMICTLVAGAIAFAAWEPIAYALLGATQGARGFVTFFGDAAWGIALALPFAISLAVLRLVADRAVTKNAKVSPAIDSVGGGLCGVVSGVVASGVLVISASYMRTPASLFGYKPVEIQNGGHIVVKDNLIVPVDAIVATMYRGLSETALSTAEPFARHYPRFVRTAGSQRMSFDSLSNANPHRNTLAPGDVAIKSSYTLAPQGSNAQTFGDAQRGEVVLHQDLDGGNRENNAELRGYVLELQSGGLERFGKFVIGHGQIWLTLENAQTGERDIAYPFAAVSDDRDGGQARFIFDGETFIPSVGGATSATMAFEFPIEPGFEPVSLTVKNLRLDLDAAPDPREIATIAARDAQVRSGAIVGKSVAQVEEQLAELNTEETQTVTGGVDRRGNAELPEGVVVGNGLPPGIRLTKGNTRGVEVNSENRVTGGQAKFFADDVKGRAPSPSLRVEGFVVTEGSNLVMIDVAGDPSQNKQSLLGRSVQTADSVLPPTLIDSAGTRYEAIGFAYIDRDNAELRYTPGVPMRGLTEAPVLSSIRDDQKLFLIFRVTVGAQVESLAIGQKVIVQYDPPIEVTRPRGR